MSHLSNLFSKGAVLTPKRNGYDLSHENLFTALCGVLTPCFVEEVVGNTNITIKPHFVVNLPPLATDFYGRVDAVVEFFFCPRRLTYGGFEAWYSQTRGINKNDNISPVSVEYASNTSSSGSRLTSAAYPTNQPLVAEKLPAISYTSTAVSSVTASGTLMDYLGLKNNTSTGVPLNSIIIRNWTPFIAYHRIWETFYRRPSLEAPAFIHPTGANTSSIAKQVKYWPYIRWDTDYTGTYSSSTHPDLQLNDGRYIHQLRSRHYDYDYFTSALPSPNASSGVGAFVIAQGNNSDDNTQFSIAALRSANTLAMWLDRQAVTGWRYRDNALSRTGCLPPELSSDPIYLGRIVAPVYNNSIKSSSPSVNYNGTSAVNTSAQPWSGTGSRVASPTATGSGVVVNNFHCKEDGVVMGIFSLVPHSYYSSGSRRYLSRSVVTDFPDALLQNAGMQKIYQSELCPADISTNGVFGWTIPYAESLYHDDEVHGLFNDGGSLSAFALKRGFASNANPVINSAFCTIPTTALDEVCAVDAKVSDFGCMVDMYFDEKVVTPLAGYIVPTLGTPDFMKTNLVNRGGSDLC